MKALGKVASLMLKMLQASDEGLDISEIRLNLPRQYGSHAHLDRRLRELDPFHIIERKRIGKRTVYKYVKPRPPGEWEFEGVSKVQRARILDAAKGRCQMCGKTIAEDQIKLHVDHRIPKEWGGKTEDQNLWAICSACNEGKKNYFGSFESAQMKKIMKHESVHKRIAALLRLRAGEWVDSVVIGFVANAKGSQTDWRKRLRELRYLGLEIDSRRNKIGKRIVSQYKLLKWKVLPRDPTKAARQIEQERSKKKRKGGNSN